VRRISSSALSGGHCCLRDLLVEPRSRQSSVGHRFAYKVDLAASSRGRPRREGLSGRQGQYFVGEQTCLRPPDARRGQHGNRARSSPHEGVWLPGGSGGRRPGSRTRALSSRSDLSKNSFRGGGEGPIVDRARYPGKPRSAATVYSTVLLLSLSCSPLGTVPLSRPHGQRWVPCRREMIFIRQGWLVSR